MKKIVVGLCLLVASVGAEAGIINIDAANWLQVAGPSNDRNTGTWVGLQQQRPEKKGNSSGALVSDFLVNGDFSFSGFVTPTSIDYDDNDIIGLVFGWQDAMNHYRLGWSQIQRPGTSDDQAYADITGRRGLFLIREVDGLSQTLFNVADWFWQDDVRSNFEISRVSDLLNISWGGQSFSISDSTMTSGRVGIYTESQTAVFGQLNVTVPTPNSTVPVSEPALGAFMSGLMLLCVARRRSRKQADTAAA